ncbi:MAG: cobalamin biosynthesis protein [Lachnospiraceae bacterium]|nr:cobalamin biosynthesis protein [Lachnospiraceae bacterium]
MRKMAICFSRAGRELIQRLRRAEKEKGLDPVEGYDSTRQDDAAETKTIGERTGDGLLPYQGTVEEWAQMAAEIHACAIFVGATGIAVRAVAGIAADKLTDIPVIVIDDQGEFVIPLLSGHAGGANRIAMTLAALLDAVPVITTATDLHGAFSVDVFAGEHRLTIRNRDGIKRVSAKALEGKPVTLSIKHFPPESPVDVIVADETDREYTLLLSPKPYVLGLGMRKGKDPGETEAFVKQCLEQHGISMEELYAIGTIDLKEREEAIRRLSRKYRIPVLSFDTALLDQAEGEFTASSFVKETVGVDNVCERAASLAAGPQAVRVIGKTKGDGVTLAVYRRKEGLYV